MEVIKSVKEAKKGIIIDVEVEPTYNELKAMCKEKGLKGYGKMNTEELKQLLEDNK